MSTRKQISTSFNIYAVLIFLLILAVNCLCTGCKNTSSTPKEIQPSDNINTDNDMSHGVMRIADFDEKTKEMESRKKVKVIIKLILDFEINIFIANANIHLAIADYKQIQQIVR